MAGTKVSSHVISDNIALGGSPTTTTQSASDNSTKLATTAYVTTAIANLADSAPSTLNTLNELAAALGDDANFSTTITNQIAGKLDSAATTTLIDSSYVQARQTTGGSVDSAATISLINSNANSGFSKFKYTATANQTSFKDSDANGNILAFDPSSTIVFYNGVMLDETADYTVGTNEITLTSGADSGVSLSIVKFGVGYVAPPAWYGPRGFVFGGENSGILTNIDYYAIATPGNASDFGDLNVNVRESCAVSDATRAVSMGWPQLNPNPAYMEYITCATTGNATATSFSMTGAVNWGTSSCGNGTYGYTMGGYRGSKSNVIDYITIQTLSDATDHGDLTVARDYVAGANDATRGICYGGVDGSSDASTIDYFTMSTSGNATNFGDLNQARNMSAGCGDATRGVFAGGRSAGGSPTYNVIEYITFQSAGNAADFGDLQNSRYGPASSSDQTKATWAGGYVSGAVNNIDYVTIQTTGNAADFGDCTATKVYSAGCSGNAS